MKVGLVLMCKNEAKIIERALNSALPLIDYALVIDTGSTDNTIAVVNAWIAHQNSKGLIRGSVIEEPWQDFGYNRSFSLSALRKIPDIDYALMIDADEVLQLEEGVDPSALKAALTLDSYSIAIHRGTLVYPLPRLTKNSIPFHYVAPAHEWLECETAFSRANLKGVKLVAHWDGARTADPERYKREAEGFEAALKTETDPFRRQRYTFYLAQSYRDSKMPEQALGVYLKRADIGGWPEEIYVSLLNAARLKEQLKHPFTSIIEVYSRAIALNSRRAEAIYGAAKACRLTRLYHQGYAFAQPGIALPLYEGLFVEKWVYDWGLLDEFSICAFYAGQFAESWLATERLLVRSDLDPVTRKRIEENARLARAKL